jgi:hypothetical protein
MHRVNDDTDMQAGGWTEAFIEVLGKYNPPNVGVVGPKHSGGNEAILTYDFTHKTHIEIFGFHYPRYCSLCFILAYYVSVIMQFSNWQGDKDVLCSSTRLVETLKPMSRHKVGPMSFWMKSVLFALQ